MHTEICCTYCTLNGIIITPPLGLGGGMGTLCRGGLGGGWIFCTAFTCLGGGWGSAPFMNLPIQTLPIPSENAGGATCRRRAASCTDVSTFGAHSNLAHSNHAHSNLAHSNLAGGGVVLHRFVHGFYMVFPGLPNKSPENAMLDLNK